MAQCLFSSAKKTQQPLDLETKKEVLNKIENCSKRETEIKLAEFAVTAGISAGAGFSAGAEALRPKENLRQISADSARLQVNISNSLIAKLDRIRNLRSHKNPNMNYAELFEDMADYILKKLDPQERVKRTRAQRKNATTDVGMRAGTSVPQKTRLNVWTRDQGQCSYRDPKSQRRCESRHLLQLDHVIPRRENGRNDPHNLRLLCNAHHRLRDHLGPVF